MSGTMPSTCRLVGLMRTEHKLKMLTTSLGMYCLPQQTWMLAQV